MARTFEVIKAEIQVAIRTYPSLNSFLFPEEGGSKVSVFNIIISTVAMSIYTFEVLLDAAKVELTTISEAAPAGNSKWVQKQILNFQSGDIITFVDNVPAYNPVTPANRIVTRCSVKQSGSGILDIKVAKGVVPTLTPLSAGELSALKDYYFGTSTTEGVGFAGVRTNFVNLAADRMRVEATVYYYGQYLDTTIKANVIAAIDAFFATFSDTAFDGTVFMIRLVDAIQAVEGVSRVTLVNIKARENAVALASATVIDPQGYYTTVSGYIISEDTVANLLTNTITVTPEIA